MSHFRAGSKIAALFMASLIVTTQIAQAESSYVLRDALIKYFGNLNLIPIFLPREHSVGDVMLPSGEFHHRAKECFDTARLKVEKPAKTIFEELIIENNTEVEGSFGLAIKQLLKLSAESDAFKKSRLVISFRDVTYQSTSIGNLRSAFAKNRCPELLPVIEEKYTPGSKVPQAFLVLSEVYYGKKAVSFELSQGANANVVWEKVNEIIGGLDLHAKMETGMGKVDRVSITSPEALPLSVRIAFVPRPIMSTTLGGGEYKPEVKGYLWEESPSAGLPTESAGMQLIIAEILNQTSDASNPLREE